MSYTSIYRKYIQSVLTVKEMYLLLAYELMAIHVLYVTQDSFCQEEVSWRKRSRLQIHNIPIFYPASCVAFHIVSLMVCSIYYGVYLSLRGVPNFVIYIVHFAICFHMAVLD